MNKFTTYGFLFLRYALLLATAFAAEAGVLPPSTLTHSGSGSYALQLKPLPLISSTVGPGVFSFSTLTYYFEVIGPGRSAKINIEASLFASETFEGPGVIGFPGALPMYDAFALLNIGTAPYATSPGFLFAGIGPGGLRGADGSDVGVQIGYTGTPTTVTARGQSFASQNTSLEIETSFTVSTNVVYIIQMMANDGGSYNSPGILTSSAFASVDPTIRIDPVFSSENAGYQVLMSSDVGNGSIASIPEPSSYLLMCAGLLGIFRSRRKQPCRRLRSIG